MKKALGQTVRDIKREVNKKVLKVPSIEQKVLDATSNEPWGPHGTLLADISQATRNYHECQMIMSVIWKRINDTGKNWRHVYKALTVLEYLVAHGSERVIDDIREHAYQISTLSDFQYIDSSGRDQGNNVRKKSQSLVVLVNDKERIQEVRQKAAANREKYRTTSAGSMYRPGSGGYGDKYDDRSEGRYGGRDDDRNGYGRERDDDRYGRYGDSYGSRDSEERYGREGYKDDDYRGRSQSIDDYNYGSRSRSADPDRDRAYEDDSQYSSRGSGAKADDYSQDGSTSNKRLERRFSEQNLGAPPSYEEAVGATHSPTNSDRDRESSVAPAPRPSLTAGVSPSHATEVSPPPFPASSSAPPATRATAQDSKEQVDDFDEFDPRGSFAVATAISTGNAPATSGNAEMDLLGSLSESFSSNSLALVPANEPNTTSEVGAPESFASEPTFAANPSASTMSNQPFNDPFGDGPFKAVVSTDSVTAQQQIPTATNSFDTNPSQGVQPAPSQKATIEFGDTYYGNSGVQHPHPNTQFVQQEPPTVNQDIDILADILPPSASSSFLNTQSGYPLQAGQSAPHSGFPPQTNAPTPTSLTSQPAGFPTQPGHLALHTNYHHQSAVSVPQNSFMALTHPVQAAQAPQMGVHSQNGQPFPSQMGSSQAGLSGQSAHPHPNLYGPYPSSQHSFLSQSGAMPPVASQMSHQPPHMQPSIPMTPVVPVSSAIVPQPSKDKFETKSTVWADTLNRGLVNLNISGSKTNPLNDIGVDFEAINRKDKRMEKPTTAAVTSTVTMGKAMGSGTGMGRAGAGPPQNPMMGPGMNITMAGGPRSGMNIGVYGANQMGRGMGMQMGMNMNNMGMPQGVHMQPPPPPTGFPSRPNMPGGYNPMMGGSGNYGQQPYGGGYR